MKAVITVIGKDMVGILAKVAAFCSERNVNVLEATQSVLKDTFAMIMLVDITDSSVPFAEFSDSLKKIGADMGLSIRATREDIFDAMNTI